MSTPKRVGILTSGGDCPGLNAVIRAVVSHATLTYGWEVWGIPYATDGLLEQQIMPLTLHSFELRGINPLLSMGGTILGTISRGDPLSHAQEIIMGYYALGLDALIAIGGDGSLAILHTLAKQGNWKLIAIPKTIDNDVALTDRSIGFDTAVNTITDALDRLTSTAASHDRVMVVEVMGRTAGHLALQAGIAGGADVILIPEVPYSMAGLCRHLEELRQKWGRKFAIVVVAEGIQPIDAEATEGSELLQHPTRLSSMGNYIAEQIIRCSDKPVDVRVSVLGHTQRGGIPSALDRLMAAAFGKVAVDLVAQGNTDQMVTWRNGSVVPILLTDVLSQSPRLVNPKSEFVATAEALGIYIGDRQKSQALTVCAPLEITVPLPKIESKFDR